MIGRTLGELVILSATLPCEILSARGGIRTHTGLPPRDFKELSPSVRDYTKHHNSALYKRNSALPFPRGMQSCAELWSLIGRKLGAARVLALSVLLPRFNKCTQKQPMTEIISLGPQRECELDVA